MKNLFRLIDILSKFAEIPVYDKCKKCGDTDPYMGDEGLCYKCFDPSISKKEPEKKDIGRTRNIFPPLQVLSRKPPNKYDFYSEIHLNNGVYVIVCMGNLQHSGCSPVSIFNYPNQDVSLYDYDEVELHLTTETPEKGADLKDIIIDDIIKSLVPYKLQQIDQLSWNNIPTAKLPIIINELNQLKI